MCVCVCVCVCVVCVCVCVCVCVYVCQQSQAGGSLSPQTISISGKLDTAAIARHYYYYTNTLMPTTASDVLVSRKATFGRQSSFLIANKKN